MANFLFISALAFLLCSLSSVKGATPDSCFDQNGLEDFIKCWRNFVAQHDSFSDKEWSSVSPTAAQSADWKELVTQILSSDGTCTSLQIPQSVGEFYGLKRFQDKANNATFCILYEKTVTGGRFTKGWGVFVTPFRQAWSRLNLHYSAAHPYTDGPVELQATAIFLRTRGRSLLVTGAVRNASAVDSDCQPGNYRADAAHDTKLMFHNTLIATRDWQLQSTEAPRCKSANCAFIQFHGKATSACTNDTIFISTGYSGSSGVYSDQNLPVNRLKVSWTKSAPSNWTAHTPAESTCNLSGTTNIFGRLLNGVQQGSECKTAARPSAISGLFIHVEQAMIARETGAYDTWANSILGAFKPLGRN